MQTKLKFRYKSLLSGRSEVLSIASTVEGPHVRLVLGHASGLIARLDCTEERLDQIWGKKLGDTVPRTVAFASNEFDIHVLGLFDGAM
jgi:hypothetical protein